MRMYMQRQRERENGQEREKKENVTDSGVALVQRRNVKAAVRTAPPTHAPTESTKPPPHEQITTKEAVDDDTGEARKREREREREREGEREGGRERHTLGRKRRYRRWSCKHHGRSTGSGSSLYDVTNMRTENTRPRSEKEEWERITEHITGEKIRN